jgi:hypothetical protein
MKSFLRRNGQNGRIRLEYGGNDFGRYWRIYLCHGNVFVGCVWEDEIQ